MTVEECQLSVLHQNTAVHLDYTIKFPSSIQNFYLLASAFLLRTCWYLLAPIFILLTLISHLIPIFAAQLKKSKGNDQQKKY